MQADPFADALNVDTDTDIDSSSTLCMGGVASPDARHTIDVDELDVAVEPIATLAASSTTGAETENLEVTPTTKNKAAVATTGDKRTKNTQLGAFGTQPSNAKKKKTRHKCKITVQASQSAADEWRRHQMCLLVS